MRIVDSQITSAYPSQTNFVVEASFTWAHDITFEKNGETITLKAGQYLQADRQFFRPGGTKITAQTSSSSYPVGLSVCKCATIEMYDIGWSTPDYWSLYEGATAHLKAAITIDGIERMVDMGSFKVYEVETVHGIATLTCYDAMKAADVLCPAAMQGDHTYIDLWELAANQLGLTASAIDGDLGYNALATVDTQHTIRQVIEAIALACGGNAMVSGNALFVRPITSAADVTLTQWIKPVEVAKTPVEVTGVRVKKTFASDGQEHTYFSGAGGYVIELNDDNLWLGIEGPAGSITVAAEAVAATAYEQLKNKPIYKFSGDLPADPRLDIFDKVIVKDISGREYPSIITDYTFVFSGKTSIGNSVESSSSYNTSDSGPSGSSPSGGGGGTIDVDSALSSTSTNPVQNKVITSALAGKASTAVATQSAAGLMSKSDKVKLDGVEDGATKTIVDDVMSDTSTNPVQNKVVMKYIDSRGSLPPVSAQNDTMLIQVVDGAYALRTKESIFPVDDALDTESQNAVENGIIARRFEMLSEVTLPATSTRDGLMSKDDKAKLDGVEAGANKTVVDAALDASSTNPVQNKAIKAALDSKASTAEATTGAAGLMSAADKTKLDGVEAGANKITVDAALDAASENPVQNKAVKTALDSKLSTLGGEISGNLDVGLTVGAGGAVSTGVTRFDSGIHFEKAASDAGRISHGFSEADGEDPPLARLKVATPTEDDDVTTKKYVDDRAVRHDAAQELTSDQKFIACENIGAVNQKIVWTEGNVALLPRGADGSQTINIMPSEKSNDYTLTLDAGPENVPVYVAGLETPTDAQTDYAANVAYVKAKIAEVAASGGVDVDNALSATSTNPVQNKVITSALAGKAGTAVATTSANGLMSKADKTKLDGIAAGANKITIDSTMSGSSVNPVQNKVIKQYVDDKVAAAGSNVTVDATLSSTSTNPVQNKAVKVAIDAKADKTALDAKADKTALDAKMDKSGGTFTGNVYGKYFCGTWLQSTAASNLGRTPGKIAVLDDSGWVYYRTPAELFSDLGITNAIKSYVDSAIAVAINSAY